MKLLVKPLLLCLLFSVGTTFSQQRLLKKGNYQYDRYEYVNAQKTYLKAIEKGYKSAEIFKKLGNSYYYNSEFKKASEWYKYLIGSYTSEAEPEYYYRYAQTLKSIGQYKAAGLYMEMFAQLRPEDYRAQLFVENKDYLEEIEKQSGRYEIRNLSFNSNASDFGTALYGDKVIYSSSKVVDETSENIHEWNKESYLDFFVGAYNPDNGEIYGIKKWESTFNSNLHESTPVFTKDRKTVYFTRNNLENRGVQEETAENKVITNKLKIYRSQINDKGEWETPKALPFNSDEYSVAHPALSLDGNKLYFSSDMPGGEGGSDLYEVTIYPDGNFGEPQNLGDKINTEGKETFPFISEENKLYFSSDGHVGLGGLDVFAVNLHEQYREDKNDGENPIINLGRPINSSADDFALIINEEDQKGYFSSNRIEGKGKDDIYSFAATKEETITPCPCDCNIGDDLGKILELNPIYFDFDKSFIRADAAVELNKIADFMRQYTNMKIEVRSHTDSRGSYQYNVGLSQRRAKSTVAYLVNQGNISRDRLTSGAYSEGRLVNQCSDGVSCSKVAHQLNRRSEFIIVGQ